MNASNGKGHGIHSPFVFDFITKVLNDKTPYAEYKQVEVLRKKLLADNTPVPNEDFGAGSGNHSGSKSISSIAKNAAKNPKYCRLLYRLVKFYRPHYVIELGTSLGISTAYLAAADTSSVVITGEGNHAIAAKAGNNLDSLGLGHVRIITGNFDNTLPQIVSGIPHIDLAFIDGNHRRQPSVKYFNELLKKTTASSMIIFDDIHWSWEMEMAWEEIKEHPATMLSIDLFFIGIIFFRPEFKVKQHFRIRF
jgi:predicted O-methyltransferase YrrM